VNNVCRHQFPPLNNFDRFLFAVGLQARMDECNVYITFRLNDTSRYLRRRAKNRNLWRGQSCLCCLFL